MIVDAWVRDGLKTKFDRAAAEYRRGRPTYPVDAVRWLLTGSADGRPANAATDHPQTVLDLAAGTGALTRQLLAAGQTHVHAAEPSARMVRCLADDLPSAVAVAAAGEQLPYRNGSFDVVTVAQAFHWFDPAVALPEIARVLRSDGAIGVVYNTRDETAGWARRFGELLTSAQPPGLHGDWGSGSIDALAESPLFPAVSKARFGHQHLVVRDDLVALAASRSYIIALADDARSRLLAQVAELFDDAMRSHGDFRSRDGEPRLILTYVTECWRAVSAAAPIPA